eukprot:3912864-Lingulodinium_polyedra.AAC.2
MYGSGPAPPGRRVVGGAALRGPAPVARRYGGRHGTLSLHATQIAPNRACAGKRPMHLDPSAWWTHRQRRRAHAQCSTMSAHNDGIALPQGRSPPAPNAPGPLLGHRRVPACARARLCRWSARVSVCVCVQACACVCVRVRAVIVCVSRMRARAPVSLGHLSEAQDRKGIPEGPKEAMRVYVRLCVRVYV